MSSTPTAARLERATFQFSRAGEYFDPRELQTMTGQPLERFPEVVLKELLDNGLDAAERANVAPKVSLRLVRRGRTVYLLVRDNGGGIAPDTVRKVLDFNTRTSDKAAYRAPTRGAQGNALKTVFGIPVALGTRAPVYVEACGVRHRVQAWLDPAGEARDRRDERLVPKRPGTLFAVPLPASRCERTPFRRWARAFSLFNPHASVRILDSGAAGKQANTGRSKTWNLYRPTVSFPSGDWRKFLPTDLTSPWWYDTAALGKLIFAYVRDAEQGGRSRTLRDFVREFRGLSPSRKAKAVCDRFRAAKYVADLADRAGEVPAILDAMRAATQAPSPGVLGEVGEEHYRHRLDRSFGVRRWWYKKVVGESGGVCFVVEVALAETRRRGGLYHGVNFSPTFDDPLAGTALPCPEFTAYGVAGFLERAHVPPQTAAAFHLICPVVETLDKGKTRLKVPAEIARAVGKALWSVAKDFYREGERRRKDAVRQARADRARERATRAGDYSLKGAVFQVMPQAVRDAAGDLGRVSAHTLFYHVRPLIQAYTSRELSSDYFEQTLLPDYRREVGPLPEVYYEPRGTLYEPHTGEAVPLGTREVESYQFPAWLYDKILFVEKKGLWPVFQAARLAERYDMAVVAGEGYATEACRVLFAHADRGKEYQLFALHDADPHGYNIARTLRDETARMPGHRVTVTDLGLFLADALALGLSAEEFTRRKRLPRGLRLNELEREYFEGHRAAPKSWVCRRVELNAFSGPRIIAYSEGKLREAGVRGKVIPPDAVLAE
ncbi:MAG TPA: ATP-binding protein, partial [Gemmataceae bacterium]|nr:ATP-binding protein [Gemmataceae bacterium]